MRTTDIIRSVLDLIDQVEVKQDTSIEIPNESGEQTSRFKQIFAMLSNRGQGEYSNTPNEIVADVDAVTTLAGGGINGPKHPADIRIKDPRGFE
jgi:hypothetical protein